KVVAGTELRVVNRERIPRAHDVQLRHGIVGSGLPDAAAASLPGVVIVLPCLAARVARLRNDVPPPKLVSGFRVERGDPPSGPAITCSVLNDDAAVGDNGSGEEPLLAAELVLRRQRLVPYDLARVAIDGDDATIWQVRKHPILPECDTTRPRLISLVLDLRIADPEELAVVPVANVDLVHRPPAVARIHEA